MPGSDFSNFSIQDQPATLTLPWGESEVRDTQGDFAHDGALVDSRHDPFNGRTPEFKGQDVLEVNGINTTVQQQEAQIDALQKSLHQHVTGIHVATTGGPQGDIEGSVLDEKGDARIEDMVPEKVLHDRVMTDLKAGKQVHIVAHSRGALVTQRALESCVADMQNSNMTDLQIQTAMKNVTVETFGGVAKSFPPGVKSTNYVDPADPMPTYFGKGKPNAVVGSEFSNIVSQRSSASDLFSTSVASHTWAPITAALFGNAMEETREIGSSLDDTVVQIPMTVDDRHAATTPQVEDQINKSAVDVMLSNHDFYWYLSHRETSNNIAAQVETNGDQILH